MFLVWVCISEITYLLSSQKAVINRQMDKKQKNLQILKNKITWHNVLILKKRIKHPHRRLSVPFHTAANQRYIQAYFQNRCSIWPSDPSDILELSTMKSHKLHPGIWDTLPTSTWTQLITRSSWFHLWNNLQSPSDFQCLIICSLDYCTLLTTSANYGTLFSVLVEQYFSNTNLIMTLSYTNHFK